MSVGCRDGASGAQSGQHWQVPGLLGACSLPWSDRGPLLSRLQGTKGEPGDKGSAGLLGARGLTGPKASPNPGTDPGLWGVP